MKKYILIIILFNIKGICLSQIPTDQEYDQLAALFKFNQLTSIYQPPIISQPFYSCSTVLELETISFTIGGINKILIIVNSSMYDQLNEKINRYAYDINYIYGCKIIMKKVTGANHQQIKSIILSESNNLNGVILIGDLPVAWYEVYDSFNNGIYVNWPCDLYYMDLDGVWSDTDGNGIYDSHTGNVHPEIFIGRISTANMGTLLSEKDGLERYLDKNHKFWLGHSPVNKKFALAYTDKDWINSPNQFQSIKALYGSANYDRIDYGDPLFGITDYLGRLANDRYEFIQLACHTWPDHHEFSVGDLHADIIFNNGTEAIGYNLFCCKACRWTDVSPTSKRGFVAGAYVYNSNNSSLVVVGSTKSGSMLNFSDFYTPLSNGKSTGQSFLEWWKATCSTTYDPRNVDWYYGMTIIGDPMVNFFHCMNNRCVNQITLNSFDFLNPLSHRYIIAKNSITANNYVIPSGKQVIFNAKEVSLNADFECPVGSTFEIATEGCNSNCP